ncbi:MAG: hypothetical protein AAB907_00220 [Patescibacteria group bacterium]
MTPGYTHLEKLFNDTYLIVDKGFLKLVCATVIANRLPIDPVWLFLVAPSAGGKTSIIQALDKVIGIYPISTITANTFVSGFKKKGKETSLLHMIKDGIITFKDFTSLLNLNQEERKQIMAQLREIYDGSYVKHFGTGDKIEWHGKIGMVAGVTTAIYVTRDLYASMGERFIMYAIALPDRKEMAKRSLQNVSIIQAQREKIKEAFRNYLDNEVAIPNEVPTIHADLENEIIELAEFSTRARSVIEREWHSNTKDITFVHTPESPNRFASQLKSIAMGFIIMNGTKTLSEMDKNIIYKLAFDSINSTKRKALQELGRYQTINTAGLAIKMKYPTGTVRRWLEDLTVLEMADRIKNSGKSDKWRIKDEYRAIVQRFDSIQTVDYDLDEKQAEDEEIQISSSPTAFIEQEEENASGVSDYGSFA